MFKSGKVSEVFCFFYHLQIYPRYVWKTRVFKVYFRKLYSVNNWFCSMVLSRFVNIQARLFIKHPSLSSFLRIGLNTTSPKVIRSSTLKLKSSKGKKPSPLLPYRVKLLTTYFPVLKAVWVFESSTCDQYFAEWRSVRLLKQWFGFKLACVTSPKSCISFPDLVLYHLW